MILNSEHSKNTKIKKAVIYEFVVDKLNIVKHAAGTESTVKAISWMGAKRCQRYIRCCIRPCWRATWFSGGRNRLFHFQDYKNQIGTHRSLGQKNIFKHGQITITIKVFFSGGGPRRAAGGQQTHPDKDTSWQTTNYIKKRPDIKSTSEINC